METIKIKHRLFEIVEALSEDSFKGKYKDKEYLINKFDYNTESGSAFLYAILRIKNAGVKAPKIWLVDKKAGYVVRELLDAKSVMNLISESNLEEAVFEQLFLNAYLARMNRMTLNYEPNNWVMCDKTLYYVGDSFIEYDKSKDLIEKNIRLWFPTKEAAKFLEEHNLNLDKNRIKDEYNTNKEIVLMTVKYYR